MPFETSRRGFLKLFGMAAGATLIAPEVGKFTSLFGAEKAFNPALGWHTVVKKRPLLGGLDKTCKVWGDGPRDYIGTRVSSISSQFPQEKDLWNRGRDTVGAWMPTPVFVDSGLDYGHEGYDEIVVEKLH